MIKVHPKLLLLFLGLLAIGPKSGFGDEVSISWKPLSGISGFELQISHKGEVVFNKRFPSTTLSWSGDLPGGFYAYRIRTISEEVGYGEWAEAKPFLVLPAPPQPILPPDGATIVYSPKSIPMLTWARPRGAEHFLVTVDRDEKNVLRKMVSATEFPLPLLPPGKYSWRVSPVVARDGTTKGLTSSPVITERSSPTLRFNVVKEAAVTFRNDENAGNEPKPTISALSGREVSSAPESYPSSSTTVPPRARKFIVTGGALAGTSYFLPTLQFHALVSRKLYLGLRASYFQESINATTSSSAFGFMATIALPLLEPSLSGPYVESGIGTYLFSASDGTRSESSRITPAAYALLGWMLHPGNGILAIGGGVGAHYVSKPDISIINISAVGVQALFAASLGLSF